MALRNIREMGDDILTKKCKPVKEINERTLDLIDDMFETMYEANGVGLAAPQIGVLRRVVVIECEPGNVLELINPVIVEKSGKQHELEGCLSVPGRQGYTDRPMHVKVEALNRNGEKITLEGEGLLAKAFCHEIDHLDGILYIDHAEMVVEED